MGTNTSNTPSLPRTDKHASDNNPCGTFQEAAAQYLIRHKSILDVLSKMQEANARVNRSVVKAITMCGCIQVNATRQNVPNDITYWEMKDYMASHVTGTLCDQCKEVVEAELGRNLFYLAALCDTFALDLNEVMECERKRVAALGVFNLT